MYFIDIWYEFHNFVKFVSTEIWKTNQPVDQPWTNHRPTDHFRASFLIEVLDTVQPQLKTVAMNNNEAASRVDGNAAKLYILWCLNTEKWSRMICHAHLKRNFIASSTARNGHLAIFQVPFFDRGQLIAFEEVFF